MLTRKFLLRFKNGTMTFEILWICSMKATKKMNFQPARYYILWRTRDNFYLKIKALTVLVGVNFNYCSITYKFRILLNTSEWVVSLFVIQKIRDEKYTKSSNWKSIIFSKSARINFFLQHGSFEHYCARISSIFLCQKM